MLEQAKKKQGASLFFFARCNISVSLAPLSQERQESLEQAKVRDIHGSDIFFFYITLKCEISSTPCKFMSKRKVSLRLVLTA